MRTERQKWDRFIEKHSPAKADAYYWCSGRRWEDRRYCVVLTAKSGYKHIGLELRADTATALATAMRDAGYMEHATVIARLCHAAGRSPKRPSEQPKGRADRRAREVTS